MKKKLSLLSLSLVILIHQLLPNPAAAQERSSPITGVIYNSRHVPIPNVTVRLDNKTKTFQSLTDSTGSFSFSDIPPGIYQLNASSVGFTSYSRELTITGSAQNITVQLDELFSGLQEVVVTTQKRLQRRQDIPVAVSALSGGTLERLAIRQYDELAQYVPGLQMQLQSPNNPSYVIRGITSDEGDTRTQNRVSVFQDGVSMSRSRGSVAELFDMERIEVVKGPQGTLFGRGAQIGAVSLIQNKPVDQLAGGFNWVMETITRSSLTAISILHSPQNGPTGWLSIIIREMALLTIMPVANSTAGK